MKKRSLQKIVLFSIITLGLYEIYWLASTRNEMVRKYRVKIPGAGYMVVVKGLQFIGAITVIAIVLLIIPRQQDKLIHAQSIPKPSANCLSEYNVNSECKNEIDKYYAQPTDNAPYLYMVALLTLILMLAAEGFYLTRWLWPYAKGVGKVTGGWSKGKAMALTVPGVLLPVAIKDVYPVLLIQSAFNRVE
jgi:hypothetical protein